jgi:copper(I)-binding protein
MFLGVTEPLTDGMVFPITLVFENAGDIVVEVTVDNTRMATDTMDDGAMDHDTMHGDTEPATE